LYVIKGQAQENTQDDFEVIGGMSLEKRMIILFLALIFSLTLSLYLMET